MTACVPGSGYVDNADDCDDTDAAFHPGAEESDCADPHDYNCDGSVGGADGDGDGWAACDECDDGNASINPGATEVCNGADDDCDGDADGRAVDSVEWYEDGDGDGFGAGVASTACDAPGGSVASSDDCDDASASAYPGAAEVVADGIDQDCDSVDQCYTDTDGDNYGTTVVTDGSSLSCSTGTGAAVSTDCDDTSAAISPADAEVCADTLDNDCDGLIDTADPLCVVADYSTLWGSEMIRIPAGSYSMGSGRGDSSGSYTDHTVTLPHDFWIGQTEITRGQWESWSGGVGWAYSTSYLCTGTTTNCPTNQVSWYDVAQYANALSTAEGLTPCYLTDGTDLAAAYLSDPYSCPGYRLPTEAEWEYAARAGEDTTYSGSNTAADVAWTYETAYSLGTYSHEVAMLAPNAWGLYDMSGNQYEWTNDRYSSGYDGYGTGSAITDPPGPTSGSSRVFRGGGWNSNAGYASVAYRDNNGPSDRNPNVAARLSRSIP